MNLDKDPRLSVLQTNPHSDVFPSISSILDDGPQELTSNLNFDDWSNQERGAVLDVDSDCVQLNLPSWQLVRSLEVSDSMLLREPSHSTDKIFSDISHLTVGTDGNSVASLQRAVTEQFQSLSSLKLECDSDVEPRLAEMINTGMLRNLRELQLPVLASETLRRALNLNHLPNLEALNIPASPKSREWNSEMLNKLRSLALHNGPSGNDTLGFLSKILGDCSLLRSLHLEAMDLGDDDVRLLCESQAFAQLECLSLAGNHRISGEALTMISQSLGYLQHLNLEGTSVSLTKNRRVNCLPHLRSLNLSFTLIDDESLRSLRDLVPSETLELFSLAGTGVSGSGLRVFTEGRRFPRLTSLFLGLSPQLSGQVDAVTALIENIRVLNLHSMELTDDDFRNLFGNREGSRIMSLDLTTNCLSDSAVSFVCEHPRFEFLCLLKLGYNKTTAKSAKVLSNSKLRCVSSLWLDMAGRDAMPLLDSEFFRTVSYTFGIDAAQLEQATRLHPLVRLF